MPNRTITFFGSGQVNALLASLIAFKNRELPDDQKVHITILGRKDSPSLQSFRSPLTLFFTKPKEENITIEPHEFRLVTDNIDEIPPQDHIILATKAYDHQIELAQKARKLCKGQQAEIDEETNIIIAQNGVPCWFLASIDKKVRLDSLREASDFYDQMCKAMGGQNNIAGAVLNLACSYEIGEDGRPIYSKLRVATPRDRIGVPIAYPDGQLRPNLRPLSIILQKSGVDPRVTDMDLKKEVLRKMQVNLINAICTMTGLTIGEAIENLSYKKILLVASAQLQKFANNLGITLRDEHHLIARLQGSASHPTSMAIDFELGNKLEIAAMFSAPAEISNTIYGTELPIINQIVEILKEMDKLRREKGKSAAEVRDTVAKRGLSTLIETIDLSYRASSPTPVAMGLATIPRSSSYSDSSDGTSSPQYTGEELLSKEEIFNFIDLKIFLGDSPSDTSRAGKIIIKKEEEHKITLDVSRKIILSLKSLITNEIGIYHEGKAAAGIARSDLRYHADSITFVSKDALNKFQTWYDRNVSKKRKAADPLFAPSPYQKTELPTSNSGSSGSDNKNPSTATLPTATSPLATSKTHNID